MRSILFVCTANICRSPMAEGVLRNLLAARGCEGQFEIDSAGTHEYYVGKPPSPLAVAATGRRGFPLAPRVARKVRPSDFDDFDLILAMDRSNVATLMAMAPTRCKHKIELLLEYGSENRGTDVPDPFGGEARDFDATLALIEDGCRGLAALLTRAGYAGTALRLEK